MTTEEMVPMVFRMWLGGLLIVLGGLWLLDATEVLDARPVLDRWWPLAVVALGAAGAVSQRRLSLGPAVVMGIGAVLLVDRLVETDLDVILWPVLAIAVGTWLLVTVGRRRGQDPASRPGDSTFALFGASETRSRSPHFRHANVAAVMGGATLDLREAHVVPGARVDALAVFGGVDVIVRQGTRVALHGLPVFGGYEDKTTTDGGPRDDAPVLDVNATAVFGGVEVKNAPD